MMDNLNVEINVFEEFDCWEDVAWVNEQAEISACEDAVERGVLYV